MKVTTGALEWQHQDNTKGNGFVQHGLSYLLLLKNSYHRIQILNQKEKCMYWSNLFEVTIFNWKWFLTGKRETCVLLHKKNRKILKRLIDCFIQYFWVNGNFHLKDTMKALDPQIEATIWSFFLLWISELHHYLSTNKVFCGMSGKIKNNPLNAAEVIREQIRKEINKATFVAVMIEELTDVSSIQDYLYSAFYDTIVAKQLYRKLSFCNRFI